MGGEVSLLLSWRGRTVLGRMQTYLVLQTFFGRLRYGLKVKAALGISAPIKWYRYTQSRWQLIEASYMIASCNRLCRACRQVGHSGHAFCCRSYNCPAPRWSVDSNSGTSFLSSTGTCVG